MHSRDIYDHNGASMSIWTGWVIQYSVYSYVDLNSQQTDTRSRAYLSSISLSPSLCVPKHNSKDAHPRILMSGCAFSARPLLTHELRMNTYWNINAHRNSLPSSGRVLVHTLLSVHGIGVVVHPSRMYVCAYLSNKFYLTFNMKHKKWSKQKISCMYKEHVKLRFRFAASFWQSWSRVGMGVGRRWLSE